MKYTHIILVGLIGLFSFSSCVRERDTNVTYAEDQTLGEFLYSNAFDIANDAATKNSGEPLSNYKTSSFCATINHNKVSMPRTISIDFGTTNCICTDGRNRRGKILVSYTGNSYADSLGTVSLSFDNYFVDEVQVFGTSEIVNKGRSVASQPYHEIITNGKFLKPLILDTIVWKAERTRTFVEGSTTPVWEDDVFEYIGTGNTINEYKIYSATNITKPLVKSNQCKYFKKGTVELQPQGHALRTIEYGDGNCDNDATVILNSKSFNIKLK